MSSQAIRAGRAFVEMFVEDESVQRSLADLKVKMQAFSATVNATGGAAFSTLSAGATAGAAGMSLLASGVYFTVNAFRVLFMSVTSGVTRAALQIRGLSYIVRDIFPKGSSVLRGFDAFLNSSGTLERAGRWGRLVGAVTGNGVLRGLGIRLERLGMGAAIERGFRDGGFAGYLKSYIGAGFRSTGSVIGGFVSSTLTMPFRAAFSFLSGGASQTAAALSSVSSATGGVAAALTRATVPARSFAGAAFTLASVLPRVISSAAKVAGLAAAISGPAILAAKGFATAAAEIKDKAKETGQSIQSLINERYGRLSFIKPSDIEAGAKLSAAMKELKQQTAAAFAQLGIAAMPVLKKTVEFMTAVFGTITRLISDNRQLITSVITVAAKIGGIAAAVGTAVAAFPRIMTAVSALLSPLGLVAVALGGLLYFFPQIRQAAADAFAWLFPNFNELGSIVDRTLGGIFNALQGGSLKAAAEVLWSGLELAWLSGTERIREIFRIASGNISGFMIDAFSGIQSAWVVTVKFFGDAWQHAMAGIKSAWMATSNFIANGFARVIARVTGQNEADVLETLREMQKEQANAPNDFDQRMADRKRLADAKLKDIEEQRQAMKESLKDEIAGQEESARAGLDAARKRFNEATANAEALKKKAMAQDGASGAKSLGSSLSSGFGSFSARTAALQGVAGLGKLEESSQKTADNTAEMVELIKGNGVPRFAT